MSVRRIGLLIVVFALCLILMSSSVVSPDDQVERVRAFTRQIEFDYVDWTLDALAIKLDQIALGAVDYLPDESRRQIVLNYLNLVAQIQRKEAELNTIYTDPNILDPEIESTKTRSELDELYAQRSRIGPVAESVLQDQLAQTVADMGLSLGGQSIPPILYHSTPLPVALIVSPRNTIRQEANISLIPDLTVDEHVALEQQVDINLDVSSLVVGIGGVGVYPTMVKQTSNINWLTEVVAHEWTHNFLTLRPLGLNYLTSPELRTMNETAAAIAGKEIGQALMEKYYPDLLPQPQPESPSQPISLEEPPEFDFRAEMRLTRETVDQLLGEDKIDQAEAYMDERRAFFWDNGYRIRKLNQAYFAFYGAYADQPGGAAGEDPVGEAVRTLRDQSSSLAAFIKRISWMSSFEQLQEAIEVTSGPL